MNSIRIGLLLALVTLGGCRTSSGTYVDENSGGYFVVTGTIVDVDNLSTNSWELLADGVAIRLKESGCQVVVEQLAGPDQDEPERTTFELISGDHLIHTADKDYVLSSLKNTGTVEPEDEPAREFDPKRGKEPAKDD